MQMTLFDGQVIVGRGLLDGHRDNFIAERELYLGL
jgi:hypothetical protein